MYIIVNQDLVDSRYFNNRYNLAVLMLLSKYSLLKSFILSTFRLLLLMFTFQITSFIFYCCFYLEGDLRYYMISTRLASIISWNSKLSFSISIIILITFS